MSVVVHDIIDWCVKYVTLLRLGVLLLRDGMLDKCTGV